MAPPTRLARTLAAALGLALAACAPEIGDECGTSIDCSVNGDRICDVTQPAGYCTVAGCEEDTCPEGGVCVEFRFEPARLSETWCMAPCEGGSDCRGEDGYQCVRASQIRVDEAPVARVLDADGDDGQRFCAAVGE